MRYWWVNQNQTFEQEVSGGYLWSPKRNANGARNPFYEAMREVAPGDLILSFQGTFIRAIGIARSHCYECPKPPEFGTAGPNWARIGWKVDVHFHRLAKQIRPREHMGVLGPQLPARYSPLEASGRGRQGVYLTEIPRPLMEALAGLIGEEAHLLMEVDRVQEGGVDGRAAAATGLAEWEEHLHDEIQQNPWLDSTDKLALVLARRGQGRFKENVRRLESRCRVTRVDRLEHLRASHLKPWRDSTNDERLAGENGLLLTPSIDHLFDRGFISFEDNGRLMVSPVAHTRSLERMGVRTSEPVNVGRFTEGQRAFLDFHRENVFLGRSQGRRR